jgi:hypothetical protein
LEDFLGNGGSSIGPYERHDEIRSGHRIRDLIDLSYPVFVKPSERVIPRHFKACISEATCKQRTRFSETNYTACRHL